jgi:hypothetical protein
MSLPEAAICTKISVSIIQAAARRQIEHWMMCIVDLKMVVVRQDGLPTYQWPDVSPPRS